MADGSDQGRRSEDRAAEKNALNRQFERGEISNAEYERQYPKDFRSSHWDEPNVVAHVRYDDRWTPVTGADRERLRELQFAQRNNSPLFTDAHRAEMAKLQQGYRTLHVAEFQSDWHQKGRERGYATPEREKIIAERDRLLDERETLAAAG